MAKLLWRLPTWVHELMYYLTGYMPTIALDSDVLRHALFERDDRTINWRVYEEQATKFSLMRFP